jgi:sterol desaturase/sphingolipid hydroxylase (fatty acid hydroxylase superfamily)
MDDLINPGVLYQIIYQTVYEITLAVTAPVRSTSDIYWLYLLSALTLGVLAFARQLREQTGEVNTKHISPFQYIKDFRSRYFAKDIWLHPSALLDMKYYLVNAVIFPLIFAPLVLTSPWVKQILNSWMNSFVSLSSLYNLTLVQSGSTISVAIKLLYTVLFFIAYDGGRFLAHCLLHDIPWLWEFHKVHHSAKVLTPFTSFRVHPIDLMIMTSVPALATGLLTWVFHTFVLQGVDVYTLLNLHVFIFIFNCVDNLRHSNVWLTYPASLNRWFISPAHHQLHHSAAQEHWGCNRGSELAIWDRLYKTLITPPVKPMRIEFGLGEEERPWQTLIQLYLNPLKGLARSR